MNLADRYLPLFLFGCGLMGGAGIASDKLRNSAFIIGLVLAFGFLPVIVISHLLHRRGPKTGS